ncbi:hypothetical protein HPB50_009289 [Hyalomma asiaticum]|uniref:Uncharacterized protein n=1 Tax=Hyalomma asiaticum TaxID=266040 RepID=A0ACB7TF04_HYAAI|nr:hypothetical protein HPB50_009289 [Hyalomma asiaticum]
MRAFSPRPLAVGGAGLRREPPSAREKQETASPLVQRWPPFLCASPLFVLAAALLKNTPTPLADLVTTTPNKRSALRRQRDRGEGLSASSITMSRSLATYRPRQRPWSGGSGETSAAWLYIGKQCDYTA